MDRNETTTNNSMGGRVSVEMKCPSCEHREFSGKEIFQHFFGCHMLKCPTCQLTGFHNTEEMNAHMESIHNDTTDICICPICQKSCRGEEEFSGHVLLRHKVTFKKENNEVLVHCPPCNAYIKCDRTILHHLGVHHLRHVNSNNSQASTYRVEYTDSPPSYNELYEINPSTILPRITEPPPYFEDIPGSSPHAYRETVTPSAPPLPQYFPPQEVEDICPYFPRYRIGDRVNAMWVSTKFQYFPAIVVKVFNDVTKCEIRWNDGDSTGRLVNFSDMSHDKIPNADSLKIGSKVLFQQGGYVAGEHQVTGGKRLHQGKITNIYKGNNGVSLYDGCHVKTENDGKSIQYRGYNYYFTGLRITDLREGIYTRFPDPTTLEGTIQPTWNIGDIVIVKAKDSDWKYVPATVTEISTIDFKCKVSYLQGIRQEQIPFHDMVGLDVVMPDVELCIDSVILYQKPGDGFCWILGRVTNINRNKYGQMVYDGESLESISVQSSFKSLTIQNLRIPDSELELAKERQKRKKIFNNPNLPKVGDRVLAMWVHAKWQYFHATIIQVMPDMQYLIDWDDGDVTGRFVNCFDLAVDKVPDRNDIGMESIVFFQQGNYTPGKNQTYGGVRWHQGKITKVYQANDGSPRYDGRHTKTSDDGKWVTYKGYCPTFTGLKLDQLRCGPNIFDVLDNTNTTGNSASSSAPGLSSQNEEQVEYLDNMNRVISNRPNNQSMDTIDLFFSYYWYDSLLAEKDKDIPTKSYGSKYSDPRFIHKNIPSSFCAWLDIYRLQVNSTLFLQHSDAVKKARIFVAFVSVDYASNIFCRMQFQYAIKTLHKRFVPVLVGRPGDEWENTIVGMILKSKNVQVHDFRTIYSMQEFNEKMKELISACQ